MRNIQVGSINGDNNQVQQNNYNIKNVSTGGNGGGDNRGGGSKNDNDGAGLLFALAAATILAAVLYLKFHEPIFLWLKLVLMLTAALHVYSLAVHWQVGEDEHAKIWHPFAGVLLCAAQALVISTALGALPVEVFDIAARPTKAAGGIPWAWEVWDRFNDKGHQLILDNMLAVIALAVSMVFGLLFSVQHAVDVLAMALESRIASHVANVLRGFKTKGVWVAVFFVMVSYVVAAGFLRH
jgi:hypothetical protein